MPYKYSRTTSSRRRMRHIGARIGEWAGRQAGPVVVSALVFLAGLVTLLRRQSEDQNVGAAVCVVGFASLLLVCALDKPKDQRPDVLPDANAKPGANTSDDMLGQVEQAMLRLSNDLASNEDLLCSLVEAPALVVSDDEHSQA